MKSSVLTVTRGIVQGSILGPTLYSVYTRNLLAQIKSCKAHMYADDTQLIIHLDLQNSLFTQSIDCLNQDLATLVEWSRQHGLHLNATKCTYIILGTSNQIATARGLRPVILVDGKPIDESTETRNLGLLVDTTLRFEKHIGIKFSKSFNALKQLYKLRPFLSVNVRKKLTDSLVLSNLDYCDIVYGPCLFKKNRKKDTTCAKCLHEILLHCTTSFAYNAVS